jgi:hypothetical protein
MVEKHYEHNQDLRMLFVDFNHYLTNVENRVSSQ